MLSECELIGIIPTMNKARAKEFYAGVLHLTFVQDDGFALLFQCLHAHLRIVQMPEFKPYPFTLLGWEVPNIGDVVRELTALGVSFERYGYFEQDELGVWTAPNGSMVAWFKDPDGNVLSLSQHKR